MCLYPVIAMSLPRRAPAGALRLHGRWIPPGRMVGCNPVALHRNRDIFGADAEAYNPGRWLGADAAADALRTMDRYSLSWGGGSRTCPGRHLAELVVFKVVAGLLEHFDVRVELPPEDAQRTYFLAMMTGVRARFLPAVSV